ncbi:MAG: LPS assembly lipoprotein LptE [Cellvibrionaceae bacterium]
MSASAAETLAIDYRYGGDHGVDFSSMPRGPLKVAAFGDARDSDKPQFIAVQNAGDGEARDGYQLSQPLAELVRSALVQGFENGGASLVKDGEKLILSGELTELHSELKNAEIEVTIKAKVQLSSQSGSQLFSSTLFGRQSVAEDKGLAAAVSASLDALVDSLFWDDYFLMQVVD